MICLEQVSFRYERSREWILRDVDLQVEPGEFVLIAGDSGSGKSTLVYLINGLIPRLFAGALQGRITVGGEAPADLSLAQLAHRVGTVFQSPETQLFMLTVEDDVAFGCENLRLPPEAIRRRVADAVLQVGLGASRDQPIFTLSGGQKQRCALAGVLAMAPELLLLDEPTADLDGQGTEEVYAELARLRRQGRTVLLVEHKLEEACALADRLVLLDGGRIVADGPPRQVLDSGVPVLTRLDIPDVARLGLSPPALTAAEALARLEGRRKLAAAPLTDEDQRHITGLDAGMASDGRAEADDQIGSGGRADAGGENGAAGTDAGGRTGADDRVDATGAGADDRVGADGGADGAGADGGDGSGGRAEAEDGVGKGGNSPPAPGAASPAAAIRLEDLRFAYRDSTEVLGGVSMEIPCGQVVALVGANGSGKSTLFRVLMGLERASGGRVVVDGLEHPRLADLVGRAVLLFQNPDEQLFCDSVREEIAFGPGHVSVAPRVEHWVEVAGLGSREDHHPQALSRGERQRLALVSLLAMEPAILLLDEPTTGLDRANWQRVLEMARVLAAAGGTVLFSTHNLKVVGEFADRLLVLHRGKLVADGPPRQVLAAAGDRYGLRLPQAMALSRRLGGLCLTWQELERQLTAGERLC